jgi:peroxiredoxin
MQGRQRLQRGDAAPRIGGTTIRGEPYAVPDRGAAFVHLQFRRFAGCPVCNFHLLTMSRRQPEIAAAGIRQVVVFHSGRDEMLRYQARLPMACVADPSKALYRRYGVQTSWRALLHPRVLWSGMRWVLASGRFYRRAENGILGLPADFLVDAGGRIVALKYGEHADDHWSVAELLALAAPQPADARNTTLPQCNR